MLWLRTVTCNWSVLYSFPNSQVICITGTGHSSACLILFYFLYCKSNVKWCLVEEKLIYLDPHCCQDFVDVQHANFPLQVWFVQLSSLLVLTIWCKSLWSSYFRLGMDMDIHGYIHVWISDLYYTLDISMDISTSYNLSCHITNFECRLFPLAIQFLRMWHDKICDNSDTSVGTGNCDACCRSCCGFVVQVVPTLLCSNWQDFDWHRNSAK